MVRRPFIFRWLALVLSVCVFVTAGPLVPVASAEPQAATDKEVAGLRTAILPLDVEGELSDADRATLTDELVGGLERGNFVVVRPDAVQQASSDAASCGDAGCMKKIAQATRASHLVQARVTVEDRDYDVAVELYDGASGESIARSQESCEICGIADAGELVATAAATLRTKLDALAAGPSTLEVASSPSGAQVQLDGEVIGTTPLQRPVIPGKRVLRLSLEGYITVEREVTLVEGVQESLEFELEKVPSRLPSRPWGWASLGLGIGAVGAAVAFAVIRDRPYRIGGACEGTNVDRQGNCRRLWNTEYHVLGFALAGAALTTLGVAILLQTAKRDKKKARDNKKAQVGFGPTSVMVRGRF